MSDDDLGSPGESVSSIPSVDPPAGVVVDRATADDELDVRRILDAAMLDFGSDDAADLSDRIAAGTVFLARASREDRPDAVVGALVATRPDPNDDPVRADADGDSVRADPNDVPTRLHVDAVTVRRAQRARGIGSALVATAVREAADDPAVDRVTAGFDADLREFYEGLGFAIREEGGATDGRATDGDRLWGVHALAGERRR